MFTGIEHFAIASHDPRRLTEFYTGLLGFTFVHEYGGNFFIRAANGALVEIIPAEGDAGNHTRGTPGIRHIALSVSDFDAAYDTLQQHGITFDGKPYRNAGNRLVFFRDPDGNLLHLIQRDRPLE